MHSLFLTPNTVILCVWNSRYSARGTSLLYHRNILDAISPLDPSEPAQWFVVDRSPSRRGLLATYHTPAFFCFHTINAYEEPSPTSPSGTDIVADLIGYSDLSILHKFYYANLLSTSAAAAAMSSPTNASSYRGRYSRYRLPDAPIAGNPTATKPTAPRPASLDFSSPRSDAVELPTIHPAHHTRPYRYAYGVTDTGLSTFQDGIGKYDVRERRLVTWRRFAQTAGEPIFVAEPGGREEDDGVLLSVVLDGTEGRSYLLVLNARTMREMGRADVEGVVGFGFHGVHVPVGGRVFPEEGRGKVEGL